MRVHILGICGTFMGGVARIARELGHQVSGSDAGIYPPMSEQLAELGIPVHDGYDPGQLAKFAPDIVIVGNALSRGNPVVEEVLDRGLRYTSGAQWLAEQVLHRRWVIAVAGTHGKTTTASLLAWILEDAGLDPGFLIGGVPENFGISARLGKDPFFVIEADEYDTAFFDKRSKFVHYRPRTLLLSNLEFDHADIFDDLAAIQRQFHHLVRTVPGNGLIVADADDPRLAQVLEMGCWTPVERFRVADPGSDRSGTDWQAVPESADARRFTVHRSEARLWTGEWGLIGLYNLANALGALAAASHAGVPPPQALAALQSFRSVKRRLEVIGAVDDIRIYDDFAHHPTAIRATLAALRASVGDARVICVLEPRSNTMRMGVHAAELGPAFDDANRVLLYQSGELGWDMASLGSDRITIHQSVDEIVSRVVTMASPGDHIIVMSNGSFEGLHRKLLRALELRE